MKQKSLLLVTVDCLRADHVGFLGYFRPTTPFLDSLASGSLVFPSAVVVGAPTYFSFPGILASRYPLGLGRDVVGIAPLEPTLAKALQEAGYVTGAFLAANPYLSSHFGYDQGFETFHDFLDVELPGEHNLSSARGVAHLNMLLENTFARTRWTRAVYNELYFRYCQWRSFRKPVTMDHLRRYPSADIVVDRALAWLAGLGERPFFLWIHLMDPHHPYYPPKAALSAMGSPGVTPKRAAFLNAFWNRGDVAPERLQNYRDQVMVLYDAGIHWVDKHLARLARTLQGANRWDDLVFAVTADHGEEFLEHRTRYHSPWNLWKELVDVPLLVRVPGRRGQRLPRLPFSLIHLAPTLLEILGVPRPRSFQGRSAWRHIQAGSLPDEPAIIECVEGCTNPFQMEERQRPRLLAVRSGAYKLVTNFRGEPDRLYDLEQDPEERSPLAPDAARAVRRQLLESARRHLQMPANQDLRCGAILRDFRHRVGVAHARSAN
jgi:arylsulfatase A-like enzyme